MNTNPFLRNMHVLNIVILACIGVMAYFAVSPLFVTSGKYLPRSVQKVAVPETGDPAHKEAPPVLDYMIIAEKNLFNPERRIPVEQAAGTGEVKPLPKPEFVLYGTLITDEGSFAYIEDKKNPRSTPGRGERLTVLRKGDAISGFTVKDIGPDRVVLARGKEMISLAVADPKRKERASGGTAAPSPAPWARQSAPGAPIPRQ